MNKLMQTLTIIMFLALNLNAQDYITVQGGGVTDFHKIDAPYTHQQLQDVFYHPNTSNGDTIYLPGVTFDLSDNVTLDKSLVVIGTGIHTDSAYVSGAGVTTIRNNHYFYLNNGSSGTEIHGINFDINCGVRIGSIDALSDVDHVLFNRCYFDDGLEIGDNNATTTPDNITIKQCVINTTLWIRYATNVTISNNILLTAVGHASQSTDIVNNLFIGSVGLEGTDNSHDAYVANNIFAMTTSSVSVNEDNYYFNNLWIQPSGGTLTFGVNVLGNSGNLSSLNVNQVFVAPPVTNPLTTFLFQANYHLNPNGPNYNTYMTGANDGGQIGIYGGLHPWKDGILPFNPHWQELTVPGTSNNNGLIGISIKGAAQQN